MPELIYLYQNIAAKGKFQEENVLMCYKCLSEAHYLQISSCPCDHIENIFQNEICHV